MAIRRQVSDMPKQAERRPARRPDTNPRFAPVLAKAWHEQYLARGEDFRPMSDSAARWRHSWAATCARALQYRIQRYDTLRRVLTDPASYKGSELGTSFDPMQVDPAELIPLLTPAAEAELEGVIVSEELSIADHWRFFLGQVVHDYFQEAIEAAFAGANREVKVSVTSSTKGAGSIDLVVTEINEDREEIVTVIEIKTINGFGFKKMIGDRGTPEGPRHSSVVQLALNAAAADADEAVLIVLSMENLSPTVLAKMLGTMNKLPSPDEEWWRFCAEYSYTRDEFMPIAEAENARVARVIELSDQGLLVPRAIPDPEIPKGARIVDPSKGTWHLTLPDGAVMDAGTTWHCGYCENRGRCISDGTS